MKKKEVFKYGMNCFESVSIGPSSDADYAIEDWYDEVQAMAASLKVAKDFNVHEDFMKAIRKRFKEG